jgi:hypothetical protein
VLLSACLLACGSDPEAASDAAPVNVDEVPTDGAHDTAPVGTPTLVAEDPALPTSTPTRARCSPPAGVSGSPRNIQQAVELMNSLPKPTTLTCFVESLDRPLELYLTRSELSVQPANGTRSPRTFIVSGDLLMAIVPDGAFSSLLELGQLSAPGRSIKGEIEFPLTTSVTASGITDHIKIGSSSLCGGCHGGETRPVDAFFVDGSYESLVAVPISVYEVDLESLRQEAIECDQAREPVRCDMLGALFDHGEVNPSRLWEAPEP